MRGHEEWEGPIPTAADCYRFALSHSAVHIALTSPSTCEELKENLEVLSGEIEPSAEEIDEWRAYGDLIYGDGADAFETRWP